MTLSPATSFHAQELLAIQTNDGPKAMAFFGTRYLGMTHQKLVEVLAYAYASTVRGCHAGHMHIHSVTVIQDLHVIRIQHLHINTTGTFTSLNCIEPVSGKSHLYQRRNRDQCCGH